MTLKITRVVLKIYIPERYGSIFDFPEKPSGGGGGIGITDGEFGKKK